MIQRIIQDWDAPTRPMRQGQTVPPPAPGKPWLIPALAVAAVLVLAGVYFALRAVRKPQTTQAVIQRPVELASTLPTPTGEMLLVKAGAFLSGQNKLSATLPAFYIDKTEVTVAAYDAFCKARPSHAMPRGNLLEHPDYAVVNVTFDDARDFAQWAGKKLPTSEEWEKAARGTDGRLYPWGAPQDPPPANVGHKDGAVMPVSSFPKGASPCGALNMIGNVWEWVDERKSPSDNSLDHFRKIMSPPPTREDSWYTIRGASFHEALAETYLWDIAIIPARHHDLNIGFRCAKTP